MADVDLEALADQYAPRKKPAPAAPKAGVDLEALADQYAPRPKATAAPVAPPPGVRVGANVDWGGLNPAAQQAFVAAMKDARSLGIPAATVTSAFRSREKQAQLYANRANNPNPVAPPGHSKHESGLAVDVATTPEYREVLTAALERHGFKWFGPRDKVHYTFVGQPVPPSQHVQLAETGLEAPKPVGSQPGDARLMRLADQYTKGQPPAPGQRVPISELSSMPAPPADPTSLAASLQPVTHAFGAGVAGVTGALNEMQRQVAARHRAGKVTGGIGTPQDIRDLGRALAASGKAGLRAGKEAYVTGEQPSLDVVSNQLGMTPGNTNPTLYGAVRAGEQLLPLAYDPLNLVGGEIAKGGEALLGAGKAGLTKLSPLAKSQAIGRDLIDTVVQPALRHSQDIQAVVRDANAATVQLRKANPLVRAHVATTGQDPLWDLATRYASGAPRAQIAADAAKFNIPLQQVQEIGAPLYRTANETLAKLQAVGKDPLVGGVTKNDWLQGYFEANSKNVPKGLARAQSAAREEILQNLAPHASPTPQPGYAQIPDDVKYGPLADQYLPKNVADRVHKEFTGVSKAEKAITGGVRAAKNLMLFQGATPVKILGAHSTGAEIALQKAGGSMVDYLAQAPSTMQELQTFWRTRKLSPAMREFSDIEPAFLKNLEDAKIGEGTKGKIVSTPLGTVHLPPVGEAAKRAAQLVNPISNEHIFLKAHQAVDQFARLAAFKALRARGVPADEAVKSVMTHVISYGQRPDILANLDRFGAWTFNNIPIKMAQVTLNTAVKRPDLLARPGQIQSRMLKAFGAEKAYEQTVPKEEQSPFVVPNPANPKEFLDLSAFTPLGEPYHMGKAALELAQGAAKGELPNATDLIKGAFGHSVLGPLVGATYEQPGSLRGATTPEQNASVGQALINTYLPLLKQYQRQQAANQGIPETEGRYAQPKTPEQARLQNLTGIRTFRPGTLEETLNPGVDRRGATSDKLVEVIQRAADTGLLKLPDVEEEDRTKLLFGFKDRVARLKAMQLSPRNLNAKGEWLPGGRERVREAALQVIAWGKKLDAAGPAMH